MNTIDAAVALVAALLLTGALTPLVARLATRTGVLAAPRPDRWGARPTPLLGGVAIVFGFIAPVAVLMPVNPTLTAIAVGALAAFVLGLVDDIRGLSPTSKLVGQVVIASGLALSGVRAEIIQFPPASFLLTLLWVVGLMNALNLVDNMDGLAAGVAAIAAIVIVVMAPIDPAWARVLAAALAGAALGFLIHNFAPARVYMGDAGSLSIGFVLAALGLTLSNSVASNIGLAVLGPLLVLGLPIYDMALVTLLRRLEGRPVSRGGRDHTSHRLAALGLSERATVLLLYSVAGSLALLGLFLTALGFASLPLIALVLLGLVLFGTFLAESPAEAARGEAAAARSHLIGAGRTLVRFGGEVALDVILATTALFSAYLIRFESLPPQAWMYLFVEAAPIVIPVQLLAFVLFGVYRVLWRFLSVADLIIILRSVALGTLIGAALVLFLFRTSGQSRGVLIMDGIMLAGLVAGSRFFLLWLRHWFALRPRSGVRHVLIVGANDQGEIALRLLLRSSKDKYHPAGFLDDDPGKLRRRIAGVPVLGRVSELDRVAQRERADLVIFAIEGDADSRARVRDECAQLGIEVRDFVRSL